MSEWKDMHTCPRMEQHTGKISKWNNWMLKSKRQYNWMFNHPSNTKQKKRGLPIYEGDGKCNQRRSRLSIHLHGGLPFLHHKQTFLARFYCLQQSREGQASLTYAYVNYIWYLNQKARLSMEHRVIYGSWKERSSTAELKPSIITKL